MDSQINCNITNIALLRDELSLYNKGRPFPRASGECHKRAAMRFWKLSYNERVANHLVCEVGQGSPVFRIKSDNAASATDQPPLTTLSWSTGTKRKLCEWIESVGLKLL